MGFQTVGCTNGANQSVALGLIEVVASWCETLQGHGTLRNSLQMMAGVIGADAVALTRAAIDPSGETRAVIHDTRNSHERVPPLTRSFARTVLGDYFATARVGSIWLKSMVETDVEPALEDFHRRRHFQELVVIPLLSGPTTIDFIEFHFAARMTAANHAQLNMIAPTLANTWANRRKGLFTAELMNRLQAKAARQPKQFVLSCDNPSRLSRAEYRVCLYLSRGLSPDRVGRELGIRETTLRTHLRTIYAKTDCHSLSELVFHLIDGSKVPEALADHRVA